MRFYSISGTKHRFIKSFEYFLNKFYQLSIILTKQYAVLIKLLNEQWIIIKNIFYIRKETVNFILIVHTYYTYINIFEVSKKLLYIQFCIPMSILAFVISLDISRYEVQKEKGEQKYNENNFSVALYPHQKPPKMLMYIERFFNII